MKKILLLVLQTLISLILIGQGSSAYYYSNPYLYSSISPSYYPSINGINRINIVAPASCNLNDVRFPGITITSSNINSPTMMSISSYDSYSKTTNADPDLLSANHNYIVSELGREILDGSISLGCQGVARITTKAAQKWLVGFCPAAEIPPTAVACMIGLALQNAIVLKQSQKLVKKGCVVTVTYVTDEIIEVTVKTLPELERSVEEAKFWMGFINSVDGMIWLMNRLNGS